MQQLNTNKDILELVSSRRRHNVVRGLLELDPPVTVDTLAAWIAAQEEDEPIESVSDEQQQRVATALKRSHLDKFDYAGVIECNNGEIRPTDRLETLEEDVEAATDAESLWSQHFRLAPSARQQTETNVLVVDDQQAWVELIEHRFEALEDRVSVITATNAIEAQSILRTDGDEIDCIVCDYRMPDIDGLELLDTVQQSFEDMPFILLTGAGNEDVASEAISEGVSDYISKQQARQQFPTLANRVNRAVEASALRQEVREKRTLYRTLVEQTDEGICITHQDEIVFVNSQFSSLTGYDQETLADTEMTAVFGLTGTSLERTAPCPSADTNRQVHEATVKLPDGAGRAQTYRISAKELQVTGQSVVVWSFHNVTTSDRRRQQLQRERDLTQAVVEILAQSSTDQTVEYSFCKQVVEHHGFQLAWVGEIQQNGQLGIQASEDDGNAEAYLDCLESLLAGEKQGIAPPSKWALRSDEPQFLDDLAALPETSWQTAALEQGLRSVAAVPLINHGITYGVFCVCATEPATLNAEAKQLLEKLADALADAIAGKKRAAALTSRQISEVSFRIGCDQFYLNNIVRGDARDAYETIVVESVVQSADSVVEFLRIDGPAPEQLIDQIAAHETVVSVTTEEDCAATRLRVEVADRTLGGVLQELGVRLKQIVVENGAAEATVQMPVERDQEAVLDRLGQQYNVESMTALTNKTVQPQTNSLQPLETADLTEKQRQALETALEAGYFDQPRLNSASEIAEMLGVSHSTLLQHLRTAQRKVFTKMADRTRY